MIEQLGKDGLRIDNIAIYGIESDEETCQAILEIFKAYPNVFKNNLEYMIDPEKIKQDCTGTIIDEGTLRIANGRYTESAEIVQDGKCSLIKPTEIQKRFEKIKIFSKSGKLEKLDRDVFLEFLDEEMDAKDSDGHIGIYIDSKTYKKVLKEGKEGFKATVQPEEKDQELKRNAILQMLGQAGFSDKMLKQMIEVVREEFGRNIDMNLAALAQGLSPEAQQKFLDENPDMIGPAKLLILSGERTKEQISATLEEVLGPEKKGLFGLITQRIKRDDNITHEAVARSGDNGRKDQGRGEI